MSNFHLTFLKFAVVAAKSRGRLKRGLRRFCREAAGALFLLGLNRAKYGHLRYRLTFAVKLRKSFLALNFFGLVRRFGIAALVLGIVAQTFVPGVLFSAYFNDSEASPGNNFSSGILDAALAPADIYTSPLLYPTDTAQTSIDISNASVGPYEYKVKLEVTGDDQPCQYFKATSDAGGNSQTATLPDFATPTSTLAGLAQTIDFKFELASDVPPALWGKTCSFKWSLDAWAIGSGPGIGFSDREERLGQLRIGQSVVLNEFIPNPVGADDAFMPGGEWVELYNNSNIDLDAGAWVLYDSQDTNELYITAANTNTRATVVPAKGFLVVYRNHDSDFNLDNDSDSVRLYDGYPAAAHTLIDAYTYAAGKPAGFSYARIPDGVGAWVDPVPTPGGPNLANDIVDGMNLAEVLSNNSPAGRVVPGSDAGETVTQDGATSTPESLAADEPAAEGFPDDATASGEAAVPSAAETLAETLTEPATDALVEGAPEALPKEPLSASEPQTPPATEPAGAPEAAIPPATEPEAATVPVVESPEAAVEAAQPESISAPAAEPSPGGVN